MSSDSSGSCSFRLYDLLFEDIWLRGAAEGVERESVDIVDSWEENGVVKSGRWDLVSENMSMGP